MQFANTVVWMSPGFASWFKTTHCSVRKICVWGRCFCTTPSAGKTTILGMIQFSKSYLEEAHLNQWSFRRNSRLIKWVYSTVVAMNNISASILKLYQSIIHYHGVMCPLYIKLHNNIALCNLYSEYYIGQM